MFKNDRSAALHATFYLELEKANFVSEKRYAVGSAGVRYDAEKSKLQSGRLQCHLWCLYNVRWHVVHPALWQEGSYIDANCSINRIKQINITGKSIAPVHDTCYGKPGIHAPKNKIAQPLQMPIFQVHYAKTHFLSTRQAWIKNTWSNQLFLFHAPAVEPVESLKAAYGAGSQIFINPHEIQCEPKIFRLFVLECTKRSP